MVSQLLDDVERKSNVTLIGVRGRPSLWVNTLYKKKVDKVRLVDTSASDRSVLGGRSDWRERAIARECTVGKHIPLGKFDH